MQNEIFEVLKIVVIVAVFTALLFPMVKWISYHVGALDYPNERKVHKKPMPVMGGLMIYLGFLFGYMLFAPQSTQMLAILIASFIVVITGILDVIKPLRAREKLVGQVVAALIIVFYGKILLNDISFFGYYFDFGWLAYPITIVFIVAVMNCINLIDGLDGLADGISMIFFITIGVLAFIMHNLGSLEITIAFIMIGACLGFLIFNFNPAKIFMGEIGSMFLGFMIAVVCLLGFKAVTLTSLVVPMLILAIPILDTLFAILRRIIHHKPIYEADRQHLHHQLLNKKFSQKTTVLIIYAVSILFSSASVFYVLKDRKIGAIIYIILVLLITWVVLATNIVTDNAKLNLKKIHFPVKKKDSVKKKTLNKKKKVNKAKK
jgi:UDP-GlcNAc:undecaprenyl-phosphate/decaprenyl-phosphate GlcNAc-1-phosphate transferase